MDLHSEWLKWQVAVLEEQKREDTEKADEEAKPNDADLNSAEPTSKTNGFDEKPDINDVPMEENQVLLRTKRSFILLTHHPLAKD